ncbi:MAG: cadherin-like beta sandwich domain-containing protein [Bacilli bacterium]
MEKRFKKLLVLVIGCLCFIIGTKELDAASATFNVTSPYNQVVIGKTFNASVTLSSAETLGSWEFSLSYNTGLLKLVSGTSPVVSYGNGNQRSTTYNYSFKAIASGKAVISVKSYDAYAMNESRFSLNVSPKTINIISQSQLEASYSKDNSLKSLSVGGGDLDPVFNKDKTEYKVKLPSSTEEVVINAVKNHNGASVSGAGTFKVSEGDNTFKVKVIAENGSEKVYTIVCSIEDASPIKVKIGNEEYFVVKRESSLIFPTTYEKGTVDINGTIVPCATSKITPYTLVGLKDKSGKISLYSYNSKSGSYTLYNEITSSSLVLIMSDLENSDMFSNYKKSSFKINNIDVECYELNSKSLYKVVYAMNAETGKKDYYVYDTINKSFTKYYDDEAKIYKEESIRNRKMTYLLLGETGGLFIILLIILIKRICNNKKKIKDMKKEIIDEPKEDILKVSKKKKTK